VVSAVWYSAVSHASSGRCCRNAVSGR
jgi:hypothetical protein